MSNRERQDPKLSISPSIFLLECLVVDIRSVNTADGYSTSLPAVREGVSQLLLL